MLDAGGDLFLDKVYFFRSSIFHNIFKRCVVFAAFLLDSWLGSFGLPSSFSLYTSICLQHLKVWGVLQVCRTKYLVLMLPL